MKVWTKEMVLEKLATNNIMVERSGFVLCVSAKVNNVIEKLYWLFRHKLRLKFNILP